MRWLVADYHPVSLFSLRPAHATTSGGQTLLAPTAFAIKMAILSAAIQTAGLAEGQHRFPAMRDLRLAVSLPMTITVIKSFAKIRRPYESKAKMSDPVKAQEEMAKIANLRDRGEYPFQSNIAYRELVQFGEPLEAPARNVLRVACASADGRDVPAWLADALLAINYLGKRGSFVQLIRPPEELAADDVPDDFTEITRDTTTFLQGSTLQMLDDCGPNMTFEHANIYSSKRITVGKERILRHVALPYRLERSSRGYSLYRRISPTEETEAGT